MKRRHQLLTLKKVVEYRKANGVHQVGSANAPAPGTHALLWPINHPGPNVSNRKAVLTSKVVYFDETTGYLETQNTLYIPA